MNIKEGDKIKVIGFNCGRMCKNKFLHMGIIENAIMEIISIQPARGPVVVRIKQSDYSIGYGMFSKLEYEIIK